MAVLITVVVADHYGYYVMVHLVPLAERWMGSSAAWLAPVARYVTTPMLPPSWTGVPCLTAADSVLL